MIRLKVIRAVYSVNGKNLKQARNAVKPSIACCSYQVS
jgi:hypothetical protein